MEGWIKLHRQIEENEFWFSEKFTRAQAWIDILLLARHKSGLATIRGVDIHLNPGQLCYSQKSLAKRWKWNVKTVNKFLSALKKREMVDTRKTNITTIITIKKWFLYQGDGSQSGYQIGERRDTKTETNKNDKNDIIELAQLLIKNTSKLPSLYSIIGKYRNILGEDRLKNILSDCAERGNEFQTEHQLAAYLETCTKTNGKSNHSFHPVEVNL